MQTGWYNGYIFKKPSILPSYMTCSSPQSQTHIPIVSPSPQPEPQEQEYIHFWILNMRRQEGRGEKLSVEAWRKIEPLKIAKQNMPRKILHCRSCLAQESLLIWRWHRQTWFFGHQSLCTCFNYAAHQQKFSFWSHNSHVLDTRLNRHR